MGNFESHLVGVEKKKGGGGRKKGRVKCVKSSVRFTPYEALLSPLTCYF